MILGWVSVQGSVGTGSARLSTFGVEASRAESGSFSSRTVSFLEGICIFTAALWNRGFLMRYTS